MEPGAHRTLPIAGAAVLAALAAAASWLCCLPLVLGVLSAGAAGVSTVVAPVRPWVTTASLVLLALALVLEYRPRRRDCEDPSRCRSAATVRRRRTVLWAAALLVALLVTLPRWSSWLIYWTL
jgi:membrane protein implicated in regulation of membrane protease activity